MKQLIIVVCFHAIIVMDAAAQSRIYGGTESPSLAYRFVVSLRERKHFCGGSILNNYWILTAVHCLRNKKVEEVKVVVGTTSKTSLGLNGASYKPDKFILHKDYNNVTKQNDIALVRFSEEIEFDFYVQPIELPNEDTKVGQSAVVVGWGYTSKDTSPEKLQYLKVKISDLEECNRNNKIKVTDLQICAFTKKGAGVCKGDSGGALVIPKNVISAVQIGIVANSRGCGKGYPDVYTRVFKYKDWINRTMEENSEGQIVS